MEHEHTLFTVIVTTVRLTMDKGDKEVTRHKVLANLMRQGRGRLVLRGKEGWRQEGLQKGGNRKTPFFGPQHIPVFWRVKSLLWPLEFSWVGSQNVSSQALSVPHFSSNKTQGAVDKYYKTLQDTNKNKTVALDKTGALRNPLWKITTSYFLLDVLTLFGPTGLG